MRLEALTMNKPFDTKGDSPDKITAMADSALMVLAARFMIVFGIPAVMGITAWQLSATISIQERMSVLETKAAEASLDRYHAADALKDFALRDYRIGINSDSIKNLDGRVSYIERTITHK